MIHRNWFLTTVLLWLLLCYHNFCVNAQSQNAIGAYRSFQKTSFSCVGRPSGYYADIETGCQVYHMCDGLGRQFSYSCPNTTLFQQRMLICDHWYMVNCSKAESNYNANLLIGQRDKPFVNDEENNLRTPRPDLLDRPYAPDYSGESFRNQYQKSLSSVLNQIHDNAAQKSKNKNLETNHNHLATGQQKWKIPPPSRFILPPAYEPQMFDERSARPSNRISYYTTETTTTTQKPASLRSKFGSRKASVKYNTVGALHNRNDDNLQLEHDDLGTSHSTRYNTSADFNSAEDRFAKTPLKSTTQETPTFNTNAFTTAKPYTATTKTPIIKPNIKVPSKIYEPPFLYPIYNLVDATTSGSTTVRPTYRPSAASPFVRRPSAPTSTTTTKAPTIPTTAGGKPFTRSPASSTSTNVVANEIAVNKFDANTLSNEIGPLAPAQGFKLPAPSPTERNVNNLSKSTLTNSDKENVTPKPPSKVLLPPFFNFVTHDVATTQGPPIYYEWKVPADGLQPPKLDSPIGVDGREYPETTIDYNSISTNNGLTSSTEYDIDANFSSRKQAENKKTIPSRAPTSRSAKETAQPSDMSETTFPTSSTTTESSSQEVKVNNNQADAVQMGKDLSVPEYAFPLESKGRTGYLDTDAYNSFQLKYPERKPETGEQLRWYGENPKCPQCHPSYVKPGTCEPCIRR